MASKMKAKDEKPPTHGSSGSPGAKHGRSGTSLVEVIVALVLFALFIAGASRLLMAMRQTTDLSRAHYTAAHLAKNQIEQVRSTMEKLGFDTIAFQKEENTQVDDAGNWSDVGKYMRTTTIVYPHNGNPNLADIIVTVKLLDRKTLEWTAGSETVQSYIARPL